MGKNESKCAEPGRVRVSWFCQLRYDKMLCDDLPVAGNVR
jgi:hypothetical protein